MPLQLGPKELLAQYRLPSDALETTGLSWDVLQAIYEDHDSATSQLQKTANYIAESLRTVQETHSIRYRIKNPEHLVAKIVRKALDRPGLIITPTSYRDVITDLIGVRVLHLFKGDWAPIHRFLVETWNLREQPTANVRTGDDTAGFEELGCTIHHHPAGYRSVHYLVTCSPYKDLLVAEVQVRTLFEEAWSEIDHRVRYPHAVDNFILSQYLDVFNRQAGMADFMGTYVKILQAHLAAKEQEVCKAQQQQDELESRLQGLISKSMLESTEKAELERRVKELAAQTRTTRLGETAISVDTSALARAFSALTANRAVKCKTCGDPFTPSLMLFDKQRCPAHQPATGGVQLSI